MQVLATGAHGSRGLWEQTNGSWFTPHLPSLRAHSIVLPSRAQVVTAGANPISVKKGIDKTCDFLVGKLRENAKPVKGRNDIKVGRVVMCLCFQEKNEGIPFRAGWQEAGQQASCLCVLMGRVTHVVVS